MWCIVLKVFFSALCHPVALVRTLIQMGHEPLQPILTKTMYGEEYLRFTNVFEYLFHIYETNGLAGCYQGVLMATLTNVISEIVFQSSVGLMKCAFQFWIDKKLINEDEDSESERTSTEDSDSRTSESDAEELSSESEEESSDKGKTYINEVKNTFTHGRTTEEEQTPDGEETFTDFRKSFGSLCVTFVSEVLSKILAIVISQPIQVLSILCQAQVVGKETGCSNHCASISELVKIDGWKRLFFGLIPRLIGGTLMQMFHTGAHGLISYYLAFHPITEQIILRLMEIMVEAFLYKFSVLSVVMITHGLVVDDAPYQFFTTAWAHLKGLGELNRGRSLLSRYRYLNKEPMVTNEKN